MLDSGIKTPVPMEELENHLRDDIENRTRSGVDARQAFEESVEIIGGAGLLRTEFAKAEGLGQIIKQKSVLTAVVAAFLSCWMVFGSSPAQALAYGVLLASLLLASVIDWRHFIIPDGISVGGIIIGLIASLLLPSMQGQTQAGMGLAHGLLGVAAGAGAMYCVMRLGKLAFGKQRLALEGDTKIVFTDNALLLPEKELAYDELFYRKSDSVTLHALTVDLGGHAYRNVPVRLTPSSLQIGDDRFDPSSVTRMEAVCSEIVLPREAMGFGDVKLMAAIGAFLGWQAVIFSLMISSLIGSATGLALMAAHRNDWSSRIPYGPFLALAATLWIFGGGQFFKASLGL